MLARRTAALLLGILGCATLLSGLWHLLAADGVTALDLAFLAAIALLAPWMALASVNAWLGLAILFCVPDPAAHVAPPLRSPARGIPRGRTAVAVCLRHEPMGSVRRNLAPLLAGLPPGLFDFWLLSDSQDAAFQAEEAAAAEGLSAEHPTQRIRLRRRTSRAGFKAGNVMDFLDGEGKDYTYLLCLDADSEMSADAVWRLLRAMEGSPRVAIMQQLIAGRPVVAAFPRLFQFGMRAGMRAWATGQGWWQGPQGPFWGHNALIRIAPFREHGRLEALPDGSTILSHDQVEAARLHSAGWEVWCVPEEQGSLEGNPPALPEFMARDLRWAEGNMQYAALIGLPGLSAMARAQLLQAMLLFTCAPVWVLAFVLAAAIAATGGFAMIPGAMLAAAMLALWLAQHAPKLGGYAQLLVQGREAARYGGRRAVLAGAAAEITFTTLFSPISNFNKARFLLALPFGASRGWQPQNRDGHGVSWRDAARLLWPHTLAGVAAFLFLGVTAPWAIGFAIPWAGGLVVAIPFCVLTASPRFGQWLAARGIAATPEEVQAASREGSVLP
ncbi:glucans biosynthesis glucosyltransferase MdoH [Roseococcus sp. YIM B11640]|uniref:glucans biosynthesis glucosyltransferase MdoH n=1 Tax=Roseococcus sp. YIM B11640 TaxID=3133973 RepID=UPI003C7E8C99